MSKKSKIGIAIASVVLTGALGYLLVRKPPSVPKSAPVVAVSASTPEAQSSPQAEMTLSTAKPRVRSLSAAAVSPTPVASPSVWVNPALPAPSVQFGFTYKVPPGVSITVMDPTWNWPDTIPGCNNWPSTPSVLPCVGEIHAVATNDRGAQATAVQRWLYTAAPTPTPTPTASPTPLPYCVSGGRPGTPPTCRCRNGFLGNSGKCR